MSDDLMKRLRDSTKWYHGDCELKMAAADCIREQRDLLDECERAFEFIARGDCGCDECNKAREMLTKLRAREQTDE